MSFNQFKHFHDWRKNWDQFFGEEFWNGFEPMFQNMHTQTNLYKKENELLCIIALPGLNQPEDVEVFIRNQKIEVKGVTRIPIQGFELIDEGIAQGNFERIIELPYPVRDDKVEATYENGLLYIHLHRYIPGDTKRKIIIDKSTEPGRKFITPSE
ncbi:MAG: Hsp20/alpha crystallin family protein [Bacillaceae bacterium]|nr:Hsp20/alpha crystallin family protein [Bacillaceae bacterium]